MRKAICFLIPVLILCFTITVYAEDPQIGDIITFGNYEQDNNLDNGLEPIEWIVLDYDEANHKALLLSRYGLEAKPYNTESTDVTWETCTLRVWLNSDFLNTAFSADEQSAILITEVDNSASQGYSGYGASGGNNTQDKVFLLSYAEANQYLGVKDYNNDDGYNTKSRVAPTEYAIETGAGAYYGSYTTADGKSAGWWWLRSPGSSQRAAAYVNFDGSLLNYRIRNHYGVVRPAFWLNLETGII